MERELKLGAPPGFRLPDLRGLAPGLHVADPERRRQVAVYWDTRDLRLTRWGCGLRHRNVDGWTAKLPATGSGPELVRRELHFEGPAEHPPAAALQLLLGMIRGEPLMPLVELHTDRERVEVLDAKGHRLVEICNDLVASVEGQQTGRRFREVEVDFSGECPRELVEAIQARLEAAGAGPTHRVAKHVRALGLDAGVAAEVPVPEAWRGASVDELVRRALARSVAVMVRHDPGVRLDEDIEDVHEMRVATRRLRSHLRTFAPLLEEQWVGHLRAELRWLGGELGRVRDADVLGVRLLAAARRLSAADALAAKDLFSYLSERRRVDLALLLESLQTPRYVELVEALVEAARSPAFRVSPTSPAVPLVAPLLDRCWRRLRRCVKRLGPQPEAVQLHALRIHTKHLRYTAEALEPLAPKRAIRVARAGKGLQRVLGEHQDAVVGAAWLRAAASQVPREAAFAAGLLADREASHAARAREAWGRPWKRLRKAGDRLLEAIPLPPA